VCVDNQRVGAFIKLRAFLWGSVNGNWNAQLNPLAAPFFQPLYCVVSRLVGDGFLPGDKCGMPISNLAHPSDAFIKPCHLSRCNCLILLGHQSRIPSFTKQMSLLKNQTNGKS
jgi:hypothetical protein